MNRSQGVGTARLGSGEERGAAHDGTYAGVAAVTIDDAVSEWASKRRTMGCVSAATWFCRRVPGFSPKRLARHTQDGEIYEHVVATNGSIIIDISPYNDHPSD